MPDPETPLVRRYADDLRAHERPRLRAGTPLPSGAQPGTTPNVPARGAGGRQALSVIARISSTASWRTSSMPAVVAHRALWCWAIHKSSKPAGSPPAAERREGAGHRWLRSSRTMAAGRQFAAAAARRSSTARIISTCWPLTSSSRLVSPNPQNPMPCPARSRSCLACGAAKLDRRAPAAELYTSPHFALMRAARGRGRTVGAGVDPVALHA